MPLLHILSNFSTQFVLFMVHNVVYYVVICIDVIASSYDVVIDVARYFERQLSDVR